MMDFRRMLALALATAVLSANALAVPALCEEDAPGASEPRYEEKVSEKEEKSEEKAEEKSETKSEEKAEEKSGDASEAPSEAAAEQPGEESEAPSDGEDDGEDGEGSGEEAGEEPAEEQSGEQPGEPAGEPTGEAPESTEAPDATEAPSDPESTEAPGAVSIGSVSGPGKAFVNERVSFSFSASNAASLRYRLSGPEGESASGEMSPDAGLYRFTPGQPGEYTLTVTAVGFDGTEVSASGSVTVAEAPALNLSVSANAACCHAGGSVSFTLSLSEGAELTACSIKAWQNSSVFYETSTFADSVTVSVPASNRVSKVTLSVSVTDSYGRTREASVTIPCAVNDRESRATWEASVRRAELTGVWPEDVIAVARTQVGYKESSIDFGQKYDGGISGYTRYGDWAGMPYEEWCGMFASFCLHYAGVSEADFPRAANCQRWINRLKKVDLYAGRAYTPMPGDLAFFEWQGDNDADHVGIIAEVSTDDEGRVTGFRTIEGNSKGGAVTDNDYYDIEDGRIVGYGLVNAAYERMLASGSREVAAEYADFNISAAVEPEAKLPPRVALWAGEIAPEDPGYDRMLEALRAAVDGEIVYARFLRVQFVDADGQYAQPEAPVALTVEFKQKLKADEAAVPGAALIAEGRVALNDVMELTRYRRSCAFAFDQASFEGVLCVYACVPPVEQLDLPLPTE